MADIFPFYGLRYNVKKIKNINKIFAPPYDVISPQEQKELYTQHPFNVIRLILGKTTNKDNKKSNRYTRAAGFLNKWITDKILVFDEKPAIYVYVQEYFMGKEKRTRLGFIARMQFGEKRKECLPHEQTLAKPKVDRLLLMRAVEANLSPIFSFYLDSKNTIENSFQPTIRKKPIIKFKDKYEITHKFWKIDDPEIIKKISKLMKSKQAFIADGHHRYEVSKMFRDEMLKKKMKNNGFNYCMVYFTGFNKQNLSVLPTHRLVKNIPDLDAKVRSLDKYFKITRFNDIKNLNLAQQKARGFSLGMYFKDKFYLLQMKDRVLLDRLMRKSPVEWRELDVAMLNKVVFEHIFKLNAAKKEENIYYTRDLDFAIKSVKKKQAAIAFFPNSTKAEQVKKIALSGMRMPQKSTYFYPKPITGLVINKF
ncbi:MAG: DUF1015 domain-containing protein [Candidatus Omnitrophota bacterium]